jgi:hypothetical protein
VSRAPTKLPDRANNTVASPNTRKSWPGWARKQGPRRGAECEASRRACTRVCLAGAERVQGEPHAANATTGHSGRTVSGVGMRSEADEQPGRRRN